MFINSNAWLLASLVLNMFTPYHGLLPRFLLCCQASPRGAGTGRPMTCRDMPTCRPNLSGVLRSGSIFSLRQKSKNVANPTIDNKPPLVVPEMVTIYHPIGFTTVLKIAILKHISSYIYPLWGIPSKYFEMEVYSWGKYRN